MSRPKLTYFDFAGSRGEECRLAFHIAGVDFEDHRIKGPDFAKLVDSLPFGALPVLEIEGKGTLAQSNASAARALALEVRRASRASRADGVQGAIQEERCHASTSTRRFLPRAAFPSLIPPEFPNFQMICINVNTGFHMLFM